MVLEGVLGWIMLVVVVLNILAALNSTYFFLCRAKTSVRDWLGFNCCAPAIFLFALGYFVDCRALSALALPFMTFFGVGGLFVFEWKGVHLISQVGHTLMTMAIVLTWYQVYFETYNNESQSPAILRQYIVGFMISTILVPFLLAVQQRYAITHWERFMALMKPPEAKE